MTARRPARPFVAVLLALALLLPPLALAPPGTLAAGECLVTSGLDSGPGTLRAAVASDGCAAGGTVTFAAGVTEVRLTSLVRITRALTIKGNGQDATTIRYTGASAVDGHVIQITAGPTTLRDLTIADGKTAGSFDGGGIRIAPSAAVQIAVNLERVRVVGNQATRNGGGIRASNAILTIVDSAIAGNTAGEAGGGIYLSDITGPVAATLTNTTVVGNSVSASGRGGGIAAVDTDTANGRAVGLTVRGSIVAGNAAGYSGGGGIAIDYSNLVLDGSTIRDNTVTGSDSEGGGIQNYFGVAQITNSTISGNRTISTQFNNGGGGLYNWSGITTLLHVTVTGNSSEFGPGLYHEGNEGTGISLQSSIVVGNTSTLGPPYTDCANGVVEPTSRITSLGYNVLRRNNPPTPTLDHCPVDGPGDLAYSGTIGALLHTGLRADGNAPATHALVAGSPAIDRASCLLAVDQRGVARPQGAACDSGAFEYVDPSAPSSPPSSSPSPSPKPSPKPSPSPSPMPSPSPKPSPSPSPSGPMPSFGDVPADYWAAAQIAQFARRGITNGCGENEFCPERPVTRAEMAAFLTRAITGQMAAPPGPATPTFTDVPANHPQYGYIEALVARGITTGCGGTEYCPDREVTRAEMAAFIIRALANQTAAPPGPATATFGDVPVGHPQYGFIEEMAARGVTTGCGDPNASPRTYCPNSNVTRAEMAVFVIRAYP